MSGSASTGLCLAESNPGGLLSFLRLSSFPSEDREPAQSLECSWQQECEASSPGNAAVEL